VGYSFSDTGSDSFFGDFLSNREINSRHGASRTFNACSKEVFNFRGKGTFRREREPTFLNLDKPYPNQIFAVVIWGENRNNFGKPEDDYKGKRICVSGKNTAYAGLPEIVADDQKQIRIDTGK
jgi:hypothetical protein